MDNETKPPLIHLSRPIPTPNSTIPELISYLRSSHQKEHFDLVINILSAREDNFKKSVNEMSVEVVNRGKDLELIQTENSKLVAEKVAVEDELRKCRKEMDEVKDELKKCRFECGELREKMRRCDEELSYHVGREKLHVKRESLLGEREKRADERYQMLLQDSRKAESRFREEKVMSEAKTDAWKKKYSDLGQKILKLKELLPSWSQIEGDELLGADSSGKNNDNGRAINKQFVLDSRSPSQMMDLPITGNGKVEIIELGDSDDDKPNGSGIALTTASASDTGPKETCVKLRSSQTGEKDNRVCKETTTPHSMSNTKRASSSEIHKTDIGNRIALTTASASDTGAKETCGKLRSSQTGEKDYSVCKETTTPHSMSNTKRASSSEIHETDIGQHKMRRLQEMGHEPKVSSSSFATSNLGDKSLIDSFMEDLVENPLAKRKCETWISHFDMFWAFEKDHKLCMDAVCAIYRQQRSKEKSSNCLLPGSTQGFYDSDVLSGTKLAEMLIDGDPEGKLRKSVSDLQLHNPKALVQCRKLAQRYCKQLFQVYKSKTDPFFFPS